MREEIFIEKTYTPEVDDFFWCCEYIMDSKRSLFGQSKAQKIFRWTGRAAFFVLLLLLLSARDDGSLFRLEFPTVFILLLLVSALLLSWNATETFDRRTRGYTDTDLLYAIAEGEERLTLTTEQYRLESERETFRFPWTKRLEAFEHEKAFALRFRPETLHFIHKRLLTESEIEQLRSLLGTKAPKVKPKKRRRVKNKV